MPTTDPKKGAAVFEFYNGDKWIPLTKQTGNFLARKALRDRFGGVNVMTNFLGIDETPPLLERSFKIGTKLRRELRADIAMESIALMELSSLAEDIHAKTGEASQNTDLYMREFLGINKVLQSIHGELVNDSSKLTEINKRIEKESKNLNI